MPEIPARDDQCCPNCRAAGMREFYRTAPVPVHSCLMLDDAAAAKAFPRGPIALGFCPSCGFVSNVAFDPGSLDYSGRYEDQQSFSRRFREFQTGLVNDLVERFGIRNKDIVEIGCGKGDFLIELCRTGGNRGVGIDPRSSGGQDAPHVRVRFIPQYYSREHWDLPCDLLACRHTLEHLHDTGRFLAQIREGLDRYPHALVFFEVPDAGRVFRDLAFWDVYYEHCSYFTAGSLAYLFRRSRFEVLEVNPVFEDQYLTIVARAATDAASARSGIENNPEDTAREVEVFSKRAGEMVASWRSRLATLHEGRKRIAVWGAGSKCVSFLSTLQCEDLVETVVDINPNQQGKFLPGSRVQIMPPDALKTRRPEVILVMNSVYREEIGHQLEAMRIRAELLCI